MTTEYFKRITPDEKALFNMPFMGFYIVLGKGEGGVKLFIKKSPLLWLLRLVFFFELNPFLLDQEGYPVSYNKIQLVSLFLKGKIRYNSNFNLVDKREMLRDDYEAYWAKKGYTPEQLKADKSIDVWPYTYDRQFFIEDPLSRRIIIPFWTPANN